MENNSQKKYFINTTDEETATRLRNMGFPELPKNGNKWVFVNDPSINCFSEDNKEDFKGTFTNNIAI